MDNLELGSDEQVLVPAQMVHIKSALFEAVLTSKRIILVDRIKDLHPKKNILLTTVKDVIQGENSNREQILTFTLLTNTGDTRQMVLTFDRQDAGSLGGEADEWVKALKKYVPEKVSLPVDRVMGTQVHEQSPPEHNGDYGEKKKIAIARPIKDQDEEQPSAAQPVETILQSEGVVGDGVADSAATGQSDTTPESAPVPGDRKAWTLEQIIQAMGPLGEEESLAESVPAVPEPVSVPLKEPAAPPMKTAPAADGTPAAPRKNRSRILVAAVIIIVIFAVAAGGFIVMKNLQKTTVVQPMTTPQLTAVTTMPTPTPTPVVTTAVITEQVPQTTQPLIPQTGVWVEITYDQNYTGWVGSPNTHQSVTDTGDHFYQVVTTDKTAAVSIQKMDGSGDELKVTIYSDGKAVKTDSTTMPSGIIDLQASLAIPTPTPTPNPTTILTPLPTLTVKSNATAVVNASTTTRV